MMMMMMMMCAFYLYTTQIWDVEPRKRSLEDHLAVFEFNSICQGYKHQNKAMKKLFVVGYPPEGNFGLHKILSVFIFHVCESFTSHIVDTAATP